MSIKKCDQNWGMFNTRGTGSVDRAFPGPPQAFSMLDERWRTLLLREKVWRHCDDFAVPSVVEEQWGLNITKKMNSFLVTYKNQGIVLPTQFKGLA